MDMFEVEQSQSSQMNNFESFSFLSEEAQLCAAWLGRASLCGRLAVEDTVKASQSYRNLCFRWGGNRPGVRLLEELLCRTSV